MGCLTGLGICRYEGDTFPQLARLTENGKAMDLTGKEVEMRINTDPETIITADIVDAAAGRVSFDMTEVGSIPAGNYIYTIRLLYDGHVRTLRRGDFDIE